jgi:hypothetical protein
MMVLWVVVSPRSGVLGILSRIGINTLLAYCSSTPVFIVHVISLFDVFTKHHVVMSSCLSFERRFSQKFIFRRFMATYLVFYGRFGRLCFVKKGQFALGYEITADF